MKKLLSWILFWLDVWSGGDWFGEEARLGWNRMKDGGQPWS